MTDGRNALLDRIRTDPILTPPERETCFRFAADERRAHVFSAEAGLTRRLIAHDAVEVDRVGVLADSAVMAVPPGRAITMEGEVVSVRGRLPIRYVAISSAGRGHDRHADVVSDAVLRRGRL